MIFTKNCWDFEGELVVNVPFFLQNCWIWTFAPSSTEPKDSHNTCGCRYHSNTFFLFGNHFRFSWVRGFKKMSQRSFQIVCFSKWSCGPFMCFRNNFLCNFHCWYSDFTSTKLHCYTELDWFVLNWLNISLDFFCFEFLIPLSLFLMRFRHCDWTRQSVERIDQNSTILHFHQSIQHFTSFCHDHQHTSVYLSSHKLCLFVWIHRLMKVFWHRVIFQQVFLCFE